MEYELLKAEIVALDDLRIALSYTQMFPDIGGKFDIILADMQRSAKRVYDLVNPDEGGMLVSEKAETPQKGDICVFWDFENVLDSILHVFDTVENGFFIDKEGTRWHNCKVIKKGEGNV